MQRLRRRWPLISAVVMLFAFGGAASAALAAPVYRATATVIDPGSEIPVAQNLPAEFDARSAAIHSDDLVRSATIGIDRSGVAVDVNADSEQAATAHALAQTYADLIVERYERVEPQNAARFPLTPHSPNLVRTALVTSVTGLAAGLLLARLVDAFGERYRRAPATLDLRPGADVDRPGRAWPDRTATDSQQQTQLPAPPPTRPASPEIWRAPRIELPRQPSATVPVTLRQPGFTPRVVVLPQRD